VLVKFQIELPFDIAVLPDQTLEPFEYQDGECVVRVDAPILFGKSRRYHGFDGVFFDGKPCIAANTLVVWFEKQSFERRAEHRLEPSDVMLQRAVDEFVKRMRFVAAAPKIRPFAFSSVRWKVTYLNNDKSELEKIEGFSRSQSGGGFNYSTIVCDDELWAAVRVQPLDFRVPAWHEIHLDAYACLPHVGSAVVLAVTSLELFISDVLDRLATGSDIPRALWVWLNEQRSNQPSIEDQFDALLRILCGHSLKEDNSLWEAFKKLKNARNNYVHCGVTRTTRDGSQLSEEQAAVLVRDARRIMDRVTLWLPENYRVPFFVRRDARSERMSINVRLNELDPSGSLQLNPKGGTKITAAHRKPNTVTWSQ
jgi:hypothetical protein